MDKHYTVSKHQTESWHSKIDYHGIQSPHFMINKWGNNGNSDRLCFLGLQTTADGDCRHEIKRHLLHGRTAMANLDSY